MTARLVCIAVALLAGCRSAVGKTREEPVCGIDTAERRAAFIVDCARAANPMSDEEGEDLVQQCGWTATSLFCAPVIQQCVEAAAWPDSSVCRAWATAKGVTRP